MKRRNFIKGLFGVLGIPYAVKAEGLKSEADSTSKVLEAVNVPPRYPEGATKYISSLYHESRMDLMGYEERVSLDYAAKIWPDTPKLDSYVISGEGRTKEQAWACFWMDFRHPDKRQRP